MVERDDEIKVLREIKIELEFGTHKVIEKLSQEKVSQQEALEKFKWTVIHDHEIKVLGEVNVELESGNKKLREKLRQEEDTEEHAFKEFSSTLDNILKKLSQENESSDDFYGLMYDTDDDAIISGKPYLFVGLDQPIQLVVSQNNIHEGLAEEVIEMANDQAEALSSDKEVTDECLDDEQVGKSRPSKRIRVTKEEMVKDQKSKKPDKDPLVLFVFVKLFEFPATTSSRRRGKLAIVDRGAFGLKILFEIEVRVESKKLATPHAFARLFTPQLMPRLEPTPWRRIIDELKVKKGMRAGKAVTFYREVEHQEMEMRQRLMLHINKTQMRTFEKMEFVETMKKL
uniref:Uncharacterized protein n=1 Tax=Tanacetum cinerariifolium TaxID=118510 RepID=A0A6L2KZ94_TANCI|nr:hypothetical protein [Tanacetum cinerariifolium]